MIRRPPTAAGGGEQIFNTVRVVGFRGRFMLMVEMQILVPARGAHLIKRHLHARASLPTVKGRDCPQPGQAAAPRSERSWVQHHDADRLDMIGEIVDP